MEVNHIIPKKETAVAETSTIIYTTQGCFLMNIHGLIVFQPTSLFKGRTDICITLHGNKVKEK